MTASIWSVLKVTPLHGQLFTDAAQQWGNHRVVSAQVMSYGSAASRATRAPLDASSSSMASRSRWWQ